MYSFCHACLLFLFVGLFAKVCMCARVCVCVCGVVQCIVGAFLLRRNWGCDFVKAPRTKCSMNISAASRRRVTGFEGRGVNLTKGGRVLRAHGLRAYGPVRTSSARRRKSHRQVPRTANLKSRLDVTAQSVSRRSGGRVCGARESSRTSPKTRSISFVSNLAQRVGAC